MHPAPAVNPTPGFNPFDLDQERAYHIWRDWKLEWAPTRIEHLLVEIKDPYHLTPAEHLAILSRCAHANMALYVCDRELPQDKSIPRALGAQFGLERLDHNWLADDDAITSLTVNPAGEHPHYIPYTNQPIQWHTDGYYNAPHQQIHGLILHCAQAAAEGGENALLDPDIAYIYVRDADPAYIHALMQADAMTIPARHDINGVARLAQTGPVFSVNPVTHSLHMRYTARTRSIQWKQDPVLAEATSLLRDLLEADLPYTLRARLQRGMGLISNNVLHNRSAFADAEGQAQRLLYRARFVEHVGGTGLNEIISWS